MARTFAAQGAQVAVADNSGGEDEIASELGQSGLAIRGDVSIEADVQAMIDAMLDRFGRLDILCNNAGIDGVLVATAEMYSDNFDHVIAVTSAVCSSATDTAFRR